MEDMDGSSKSEAHLSSAAAFVEGGIQDACDDACSICLEIFCDSDPCTVTNCKHEFHLQCILEWCQRSSQCPMCWQPIGLKDPSSQELLEAVERERSFKFNPARNATIFHHPSLGDFELQHLPIDASDAELEERIIQHLAAAAAMGRRHLARREGQRYRSSGQGRSQFVVFSNHPNSPPASSASSATQTEGSEPVASISAPAPHGPPSSSANESSQPASSYNVQTSQVPATIPPSEMPRGYSSSNRGIANRYSPPHREDKAGPSEFQSISDSIRTKFNAFSMRYKESFSKGTRGWKEKWLSRNSTVSDIGNEVRREVNAGIATVSRMMERLETRDRDENELASVSNQGASTVTAEPINPQLMEVAGSSHTNTNPAHAASPPATASGSNEA